MKEEDVGMDKYQIAINLMEEFQCDGTGDITQQYIKKELPSIWLNLDNPQDLYTSDEWIEIFRYAGFMSDHAINKPTKKLTIYRASEPKGKRNLSWTTSLTVAKWFNERNKRFGFKDSNVYQATIEPQGILAMIKASREDEIIIDNYFLKGIEKVCQIELDKVEAKLNRDENELGTMYTEVTE